MIMINTNAFALFVALFSNSTTTHKYTHGNHTIINQRRTCLKNSNTKSYKSDKFNYFLRY